MSFRDVVVLLPGITGSVLTNDRGKEIWSPTAGTVWRAIHSLGDTIDELELGGDNDPRGVKATRLVSDVTIIPGFIKIDGYTRIEDYLVNSLALKPGENYFSFPYDWRLDNRINAKRLEEQATNWLKSWRTLSGATEAKLVLVGHSMGGLVSRYFIECLGGWKITRRLITLGTPHSGSLNAIDQLVHGMKRGIGPFGVDFAPMLRSYPSVYQLLPIYECIDDGTKDLLLVNEASDSGLLPYVRPDWVRDARSFHKEIDEAQASNAKEPAYQENGYRIVSIVGIEQPTNQSAKVSDGNIELLRSYKGEDLGGDGTVPRVSATPRELSNVPHEVYAAEKHGSLQNADGSLANIKGILTRPDIARPRFRDSLPSSLTLDVEDVVLPGEPLRVRSRAAEGNPAITALLTHLQSGETLMEPLKRSRDSNWLEIELDAKPGTWRVRVEAEGVPSVNDLVVVAES
jgi:pimeloyl-ACP methyl ester carboxylesterase